MINNGGGDPYRYSKMDNVRSMLHMAPLVMHPLAGAYVYQPQYYAYRPPIHEIYNYYGP